MLRETTSPVITIFTTRSNDKKTQNLPTQFIYVFCVDPTTKWLYFSTWN